MLLVDFARNRIVGDDEIKHEIASQRPYAEWLERNKIDLARHRGSRGAARWTTRPAVGACGAFGYSREDVRILLAPMASNGEEPIGSMGNDAPLAVLSGRPQILFRYFKQQFAQVTNPPIDPIREKLVMTLTTCLGGEGNLLEQSPQQCRLLELEQPILTNEELAKLTSGALVDFPVRVLPALFAAPSFVPGSSEVAGFDRAGAALEAGLSALCAAAEQAVDDGASIIVLSDRGVDATHAAIPSLLATSAVHHALTRSGKRMRAGIVVETGEAREVADVALLIGYGAGAVNPYLAFEVVAALDIETAPHDRAHNYLHALDKGLLKVMSKMGISCLSSYQGAQIFEAIGIGQETIDRWLPGTHSRVGGIGLAEIAHESLLRHAAAFEVANLDAPSDEDALEVGGVYAWRVGGERHLWEPETVASLAKGGTARGRQILRSARARHQRSGRVAVQRYAAAGISCRVPLRCPSKRSNRRPRSSAALPPGR